jgi:hypothetical protein
MGCPTSLGVAALVALSFASPAYAFDETNLSGLWRKPPGIGNQWDQTKPLGLAQEPPFTPEYQAIFEAVQTVIQVISAPPHNMGVRAGPLRRQSRPATCLCWIYIPVGTGEASAARVPRGDTSDTGA